MPSLSAWWKGRRSAPVAPVDPEFAERTEAERCELVFAFSALEGERSRELLARALEDPSEIVALAAAHELSRGAHGANLDGLLRALPNERSQRLRATLDLFE